MQTAYRIVRKGNPATALVRDDSAPVPTNIPKEHVLIKVQAVSLNPMCALLFSPPHVGLKRMSVFANVRLYSAATS